MKYWLFALIFITFGCAHKTQPLPAMYIDAVCLIGPIELERCDFESPPNCKKVKVHYKPGCERISAK